MNKSEEDLRRILDEQRLLHIDGEISRIKSKIVLLKTELKFKNQEKADIEYHLREGGDSRD